MPSRSRSASLQSPFCTDCRKLEELVRKWRLHHAGDASFTSPLSTRLHDSYQQVEKNAESGCPACRAVRRSLLQHQMTWEASRELTKSTGAVDAKLSPRNEPLGSEFTVDITVYCDPEDPSDVRSVRLLLTDHVEAGDVDLPTNSEDHSITDQVKTWIDDCYEDHNHCSNLQWSLKNPSLLIQILRDDELRLVVPPLKPLLKYSALSYSWGNREKLSVDETSQIEHAKTRRRRNSRGWSTNFEQRMDKFSLNDLPSAMRDAIKLTKRLGIDYIWIDQVCIGDAEDWNHEASRMHEVYGNAHVTICACSTEKATDGLYGKRTAWDYAQAPCTIEDLQLVEYDMSLKQVRMGAPIFKRAWILQEERLSPRIIYWCSQRVYWSCSQCTKTESTRVKADGTTVTTKPYERHISSPTLLQPQSFMDMRWKMETKRLHEEWLDLVPDFTKRAIYDAADRFPAMSGLAAQYLTAFTDNQTVEGRQEYLAGLWRETFAQDLTWTVLEARSPTERHNFGPGWSWMSLPQKTLINITKHFQPSPHFELTEPSKVKSKDRVFEVVKRGADINAVRVKGRLRPFAPKHATIAEWHDIVKTPDNDTEFMLSKFGMKNIVARHIVRGKVLAYEANRQEVTAQLDYSEDYGDLRNLWCLEVGKSSMLILVKANKRRNVRVPAYIRIGAGHGFHEGFFSTSIKVQEIDLVARQEPLNGVELSWLLRCFLGFLLGIASFFFGTLYLDVWRLGIKGIR